MGFKTDKHTKKEMHKLLCNILQHSQSGGGGKSYSESDAMNMVQSAIHYVSAMYNDANARAQRDLDNMTMLYNQASRDNAMLRQLLNASAKQQPSVAPALVPKSATGTTGYGTPGTSGTTASVVPTSALVALGNRDGDVRDIRRDDGDVRDIRRDDGDIRDNISLDKRSDRSSMSLQNMIWDMRIRKHKNMLYMTKDENHPIISEKINEWVDLQCNDTSKTLAGLFRDNTRYISWKQFYTDAKVVFDKLYAIVRDKKYCIFTKDRMGSVDFDEKSNYWMAQLLIDYYITSGKTNLPHELLLCSKNLKDSNCPASDYDYYVSLDDCIYSGGQMFTDAILTRNISPDKIIVASPYTSQYAFEKYSPKRGILYNTWVYAEIMEYWWYNKSTVIGSTTYNLNNENDRKSIFELLKLYFPSPRIDKTTLSPREWNINNFMYYFDHKIADYASSFPTVYHTGIIVNKNAERINTSTNTHNTERQPSNNVCTEITYLPFIKDCMNNRPILDDIDERAKSNPEKLCIEPWYKKKFDKTHAKKVLVLDFDDTLTGITIEDNDAATHSLDAIFTNKHDLIDILQLVWDNMIPVYIVSRRVKHALTTILNRFYTDNNITFTRIYDENILGRPDNFVYPYGMTDKNMYWARVKKSCLDFIVKNERIRKEDILFCDDSSTNINVAKNAGFINSIKIDKSRNATHVLQKIREWLQS